MSLTTDRNDPALKETLPSGQQAKYLVLSDEERAKGFVRPVRRSYRHVGSRPKYPLRDLTDDERDLYADETDQCYCKFEEYPKELYPKTGRFWTQKELNTIGCGSVTTMGEALCETYARNPKFYGATFCAMCGKHFPVGEYGEFVWEEDGERVGT